MAEPAELVGQQNDVNKRNIQGHFWSSKLIYQKKRFGCKRYYNTIIFPVLASQIVKKLLLPILFNKNYIRIWLMIKIKKKIIWRWDHYFLKETVTFLSQNYTYYNFLSISLLKNTKLWFCDGNVKCLKNISDPIVDPNY